VEGWEEEGGRFVKIRGSGLGQTKNIVGNFSSAIHHLYTLLYIILIVTYNYFLLQQNNILNFAKYSIHPINLY
jgi:hypothetical protein